MLKMEIKSDVYQLIIKQQPQLKRAEFSAETAQQSLHSNLMKDFRAEKCAAMHRTYST